MSIEQQLEGTTSGGACQEEPSEGRCASAFDLVLAQDIPAMLVVEKHGILSQD